MSSLLTKLDPRNINWQKSPHKVTPEIRANNDAKISELEKEQKLLESKLKRGVYKSNADFNRAWGAQNRSMQRMIDYRDRWDEIESTHPIVNKQREKEKDRFVGKAIAIQKKYENVIMAQAQKQGVCGYLSKKTCSEGKDCYWFGKKGVAGKNVGCYSSREETIPIGQRRLLKRSKKPTLSAIQENPLAARQYEQKRNEEKKETKTYPTRPSSSYPDRFEGGKKKTKRRKRRRKRKKTRRKRKRRTKRRTKRRKR